MLFLFFCKSFDSFNRSMHCQGRFTRRVDAWAPSRPIKTTLGRKGSRLCCSSALLRLPFMMLEARSSAGWLSVVSTWTMLLKCLNSAQSNPPCFSKPFPSRGGWKFLVQKMRRALAVAVTMSSALPPFIRTEPRVPPQTSNVSPQPRKRIKSFPFLSSRTRQRVVAAASLQRQRLKRLSDKHQCIRLVRSLLAPPLLMECPFRIPSKTISKSL